MSVKTFLEKAGEDILKVITFGEAAAKAAEPIIAVTNPALASLIDSAVNAVQLAQASTVSAEAAAPGSTDTQKLAIAVAAIGPQAELFAKSLGASAATVEQKTAFINAIVAALNAFEVPSTK
jgi:hypothetical protein